MVDYVFIHLSKSIAGAIPRVNPNVNYRPLIVGSSIIPNVPLWWGMLIEGEAAHV